jgi:hypothetical protein
MKIRGAEFIPGPPTTRGDKSAAIAERNSRTFSLFLATLLFRRLLGEALAPRRTWAESPFRNSTARNT